MSLIWTLVLAVVQGLTEFLPVSSSAHLVILGALAKIDEADELGFFIALHLGTVLAMAAYFWGEIRDLARSLVRRDRAAWRYLLLIFAATLPTALIGFSLKRWVEHAISKPAIAGGTLLITAAFLYGTKFLPEGVKGSRQIRFRDALLVGTAQGLAATFRGISRSGATISASMALGLTREEAFRFSFLASLPAVAGATLLESRKLQSAASHMGPWTLLLAGGLAFAVGILALSILRKTVVGKTFHWYSVWCVLMAICGLAVGFMG